VDGRTRCTRHVLATILISGLQTLLSERNQTLNFKSMICVGAAVVGVTASTAVASASAATTITENGSSLVYPLVSQWKTGYASQGSVSPTSSSSGTGIDLIQTNAVNIGASDAPMTSSQYAGDSHSPTQIPWALSATGVGYDIPGVGSGLKLDAAILVGIYEGKITKWNNAAIVKLNPKLKAALGKAPAITAVVRTGGSGDTYAFQHFLSVADPKGWTVGFSTNWLGGSHVIAENGNSGVAGEVRSNPGAIGYISAYYLISQHVTTAAIENAAGNFELPNPANIKDASLSDSKISAQGAGFTGVSIVYPSKKYKTAYPISTYTYAIVNSGESDISDVQSFLTWAVTKGQSYGGALDFVPLPAGIVSADESLINSL
jgi:phosphate transport system substrate-binding protein